MVMRAKRKTDKTSKAVIRQPPTVRVTERCKAEMEALAVELDISQTEVLDRAVSLLRRSTSLKQMEEDYEAIAADSKAFKSLRDENRLFDGITSDGID